MPADLEIPELRIRVIGIRDVLAAWGSYPEDLVTRRHWAAEAVDITVAEVVRTRRERADRNLDTPLDWLIAQSVSRCKQQCRARSSDTTVGDLALRVPWTVQFERASYLRWRLQRRDDLRLARLATALLREYRRRQPTVLRLMPEADPVERRRGMVAEQRLAYLESLERVTDRDLARAKWVTALLGRLLARLASASAPVPATGRDRPPSAPEVAPEVAPRETRAGPPTDDRDDDPHRTSRRRERPLLSPSTRQVSAEAGQR